MPGNTPTGLLPTGRPAAAGRASTRPDRRGERHPARPGGGAASPAARQPAAGGRDAPERGARRGAERPRAPGDGRRARPAPPGRPGRRTWFRMISPLVVLVVWQLVSMSGLISQQKLPSPSTVLHTAVTLITTNTAAYGTLQGAMLVSLERVAIGFAVGGAPAWCSAWSPG